MSRVGQKPIILPSNINVSLTAGAMVVNGPKGELRQHVPERIKLEQQGESVTVIIMGQQEGMVAKQGLVRALLANMIKGVTEGYEKKLELVGAGYRARVEGNKLNLALGFSHPVWMEQPEGINFAVEENTRIIVKGIDKQLVGETAG